MEKIINVSNKKILVKNLEIIDHNVCFYFSDINNAKTTIKNFETVFTSSPSFLKIMKNRSKI